jgi:primosomal protein N' (replication factor Y)
MLEFNENVGIVRKTIFIEVILPLAISKTYTYRVPHELVENIAIGKRVVVQFGRSKIYTAIICLITETPPALYEAKYIIDVLDNEPIVNEYQLKLWQWMSDYYLCHLGEVMQAALPSALKLASETRIVLNTSEEIDKSILSDKEFLIVDALELHPELSVSDISKLLGQKTVFPLLRALFEKNVIIISEEISDKFKPKKKAFIILNPQYKEAENRKALFEVLERAPKQLEVLLAYFKLEKQQDEISKADLIETSGTSASVLKALIDKEIFVQEDKVVSRLSSVDLEDIRDFELNEAQSYALQETEQLLNEKGVVLLYGETSSGKTQIYIRLIEQMLLKGDQTLYLLPEIALTTQVIERLREHFGGQIGVYHSKFNDNERAEVWQKVLKGEYKIVLGARS